MDRVAARFSRERRRRVLCLPRYSSDRRIGPRQLWNGVNVGVRGCRRGWTKRSRRDEEEGEGGGKGRHGRVTEDVKGVRGRGGW